MLLAKVNTDEEHELAAQYAIQVLPTVVAFKDGKAVLSFEGVLPETQLVDFLDRIVPSQAERTARGDRSRKDQPGPGREAVSPGP